MKLGTLLSCPLFYISALQGVAISRYLARRNSKSMHPRFCQKNLVGSSMLVTRCYLSQLGHFHWSMGLSGVPGSTELLSVCLICSCNQK